jgi:predicted dehydrogenase
VNRRLFCSAALTVALTNARSEDRIKVGFLGASYSHAEGKIEVLRDNPDYEITEIWEPDPKLTAKYAKAGFRMVSKSEILNDPSIRVAVIETDVGSHAEHAREALQAGKHTHVEKPPTDSLADLAALQREAQERNLLLQVGYMWRYNPASSRTIEAAQRDGWERTISCTPA